jgi:hypothetical protein
MLTHPFPRGQTRMVGRASQYVVAACSGILHGIWPLVGLKGSTGTAAGVRSRSHSGNCVRIIMGRATDCRWSGNSSGYRSSQLLENYVTRTHHPHFGS